MQKRPFASKIHAVAGGLAFLTILSFLSASLVVEVIGARETITGVKQAIAWALLLLVPALMATGASGFAMVGMPSKGPAAVKFRRMRVIGANGVMVLVPAALFLAWKAGRGEFDGWFAGIQALEFAAGLINLTLIGFNIRDGLRMTGRLRPATRARRNADPSTVTPATR